MSESIEQTSETAAATSFFERPGVHLETIEVGPGVPLGIEQAANPGIGIGGGGIGVPTCGAGATLGE